MTILDQDLFFLENGRMAVIPGTGMLSYPFPTLGDPKYLDLASAIDFARTEPIYACFRITATFAGAAANTVRFAIFADSVNTFANLLTTPSLVIARGPDLATPVLVADQEFWVAMPPLNTINIPSSQGTGLRYLSIGWQADAPVTDFTGGALTAFLTPYPRGVRASAHTSGY